MATRLTSQALEKPWGRRDLSPWTDIVPASSIGEMVYSAPEGDAAELLVKILFTADRLSVQVHPPEAAALASGYPRGKDEAWLILEAVPGATIALGLREPLAADALAAAALDGSIEHLLDWRVVKAGDLIFAPAGTIHAIGAGITLVEIQQNLDLTYRLFDYGRPRELHLAAGVAVADVAPWRDLATRRALGAGRVALVEGPSFVIERIAVDGAVRLEPAADRPATLVLLSGQGTLDGQRCTGGEVWMTTGACDAVFDEPSEVLVAYPGADVVPALWTTARVDVAA